MAWSPDDAPAHTGLAVTPSARKQWADIANWVLAISGDEVRAITLANKELHTERVQRLNRRVARQSLSNQPRLL